MSEELLTRIESAIARVTFSRAAKEVLAELSTTHRLVERETTIRRYELRNRYDVHPLHRCLDLDAIASHARFYARAHPTNREALVLAIVDTEIVDGERMDRMLALDPIGHDATPDTTETP